MENRINIGELDTMVLVQSCTIGRGDRGQKTYTYADHSCVYAKVERNIDESVQNFNLEQGQILTLTMYKIAAMTTRWRIVVNGQSFSVTAIDPVSRFSPLCTVTLTSIE